MSKYSVGQKFIIEIGAERLGDPTLYRIKGFNTLVFDDNGLDRLEQVNNSVTLRDAYDEGFEKGLEEGRNEKDCKACMDAKANADYNSGYEDGLRDAWECVRHILRMEWKDRHEAFNDPSLSLYEMLGHMTPDEAITKLKEYEAMQAEIKVGDEVIDIGDKGVVTYTDNSINVCDVLWYDGSVSEEFEKKILRKTGRHYDIDGILEQLKGADDE